MAKPTIQQLADAVGVSRITVWKALNNRSGVSDKLREQIQQQAAQMGLIASAAEAAPVRTLSVVVARPESSLFWMQIIHHIAKELSGRRVNLMYTYVPSHPPADYSLPESLSPATVDGFIVLNVYDERLLHLLAAQPLPKVFLDTAPAVRPRHLHGDLLIIEGRDQVRRITRRLIEGGRQRIGFIGDTHDAQTNLERYEGFRDGMNDCGLLPSPALCMTGPISLKYHYEEIAAFLNGLPELPEAIVCPSDFIAHFVTRYLEETGRAVPENFVLTGFDNSSEYPSVAGRITTVGVDTSSIGKRLARKLLFRTDYPASPTEVCYEATQILWRGGLEEA